MSEKVKVTIDGITIEVEPGTSILNAARQIGGDIVPPAMCYYSKLEGSGGKCRTCLVKVSKGSEKDPRPKTVPRHPIRRDLDPLARRLGTPR